MVQKIKILILLILLLYCSNKADISKEVKIPPDNKIQCFVKAEGWEIQIEDEPFVRESEEGLLFSMLTYKDHDYIMVNNVIQQFWDGKVYLYIEKIRSKKIKPLVKVGDIILKINECDFDTMFPVSKDGKSFSSGPYVTAGYISLFYVLLLYDESKAKEYIESVTLIRDNKEIIISTKK